MILKVHHMLLGWLLSYQHAHQTGEQIPSTYNRTTIIKLSVDMNNFTHICASYKVLLYTAKQTMSVMQRDKMYQIPKYRKTFILLSQHYTQLNL